MELTESPFTRKALGGSAKCLCHGGEARHVDWMRNRVSLAFFAFHWQYPSLDDSLESEIRASLLAVTFGLNASPAQRSSSAG